ncbi:Broad-complex core protein isoform 6,Sex determination protein fruitless,Protein tramtrack, alpha isoform,Protein bric-a-brac 2,Longitudinals lacking protein, isoforms H/M/V,Protein bric-a-brac 1,Longitudinals lacking protein, isoforms A/B/D/L,Protein tramtrack, beta isoform,Longitudinals lacking protein, isoforms J/P/Q/S/Z,Longitudinals lacking protein, isoforms F/I/K/T,Longitudinals lacking protein-like,Broad-complex core protein isoforms 1/2/3/4/5,Longitudinals lacking protein, isoforms N/O/W/X/Y,Protei|uniref:Broad-complex core protein n=1 Tax=Lepeophtheirus salmonis TaxID=72036 RepID=A0A7R8H403_LEPSM|nr:Broad-complex core protein isoform 6,Sex determination protein fruitless,Protein tramtrack, alpha isoform,Protein bric-a-brac 2,Longitudinals lacking protein, isoforms H/M/V,Protein bric-a-brac 1,Longitudinals lacking protein, isoforms A/B/D/L,Protein tramtrack, beta isoform,Longitudinals lacking protein, isoforms J/P/Q/S/Z,Longitudinals lacking protein, isoforms F/I/K/T,Longitudinals lacking protein-like,Broad-complex core protein isoforms 1/2/3/4/5,Longitudinals lacking protein, isoforms N/O/W
MTSEQFCLKWNNYQSNIVSALGNLKLDEDFVDVTLSCEGRTIKAHKVILSACSLYFRDVFRETPCNHPIIILKDTQYSDLESLVKYVYQGQVYISQENLSSFLKTADALQIKGLAEQSQPAPSGSNESSPNSSPDHDQSPFPETINKNIQVPSFPAPPMSPVLSSSYPSQSSSATTLPRTSPIKIPTISHLKRSSFSNLAQYLSGSNAMSSPPLNGDSSPPLDWKCFIQKTKGSPPHSHSTDGGGEHSLEMGEESDRDSARSIESTDLVKPPIISDYDVSTKEHHHHHHHPQPMTHSPFHNHTHYHHPRLPLMVNDKKEPDDFGETLDLSKKLNGGVLEAALTASDPLTSGRNIGTVPTPKRSSMHSSAPTSSSSSTTTNTTTLPPNGGLPSQSKDKDGQGRNSLVSGQCPHCGNEYTNFSSLKYHVRLIHSEASNTLCCYLCPSSFVGRASYKEHLISIHGVKHQ